MASNHVPFGTRSFQDYLRSQPRHPPLCVGFTLTRALRSTLRLCRHALRSYFVNFGTGNRDRTCGLTIIGRLLYQLSYTRIF